MQKTVEILWHRARRNQVGIVADSDKTFAIDAPIVKPVSCVLLCMGWILGKMRRGVDGKKSVFAETLEQRQSCLDRVDQVLPRLRLGSDARHELVARGAIHINLDARIFFLESLRQLLVRAPGQRSVPDDFAFRLGTRD